MDILQVEKNNYRVVYISGVSQALRLQISDSHHVSPEDGLALHVFEAEFADIEATQTCVLFRIGRVVPGVQLVAAKQDGLDHVTALSDLTLDTQLLLQEKAIVSLLILAPT